MPVPGEPDAVLVLRPCAIATLDLMAPGKGVDARGRRSTTAEYATRSPTSPARTPDSATCASTQVSGTIVDITVIQE